MSEVEKSNAGAKVKGILIVGPMGSGKDVFAEAFQRLIPGAVIVKLGKAIREDVDRLYPDLENKREKYQEYGQNCRNLHGQNYWNDRLWESINNEIPMQQKYVTQPPTVDTFYRTFPIIADGRQVNECAYWRKKGFLLIGVTASEYTRKERLMQRDGYVPDDKDFLHDTELQSCYSAATLCDYHFPNTGDIKFLDHLATIVCDVYKLV